MMLRNLNHQFKSVTTNSGEYSLKWVKETRSEGEFYLAEFQAQDEVKQDEGKDVASAIMLAINPTAKACGAFKNAKAAKLVQEDKCYNIELKAGSQDRFYCVIPAEIIDEFVKFKIVLPKPKLPSLAVNFSSLFSCCRCSNKQEEQTQEGLGASLLEKNARTSI